MILRPVQLSKFILATLLSANAFAEVSFYETEPNNTPADAHRIAGALNILGAMPPGDQDGFRWTVSDVDARKRWTFELQGIAGALTVVQIFQLEYAENGVDVIGQRTLMKFGSRDGLTPAVAADLLFEPGEYLIGLASAGGTSSGNGPGMFRPPASSLSFGAAGTSETPPADAPAPEPAAADSGRAYRFSIREGSPLLVQSESEPRTTRDAARTVRPSAEFASLQSWESAWFALEFSPEDLTQRWDLTVQVPVGRILDAIVYNQAGERLTNGRTSDRGQLRFPDLAPESYAIELRADEPGFIQAIGSVAVGQRVAGEEAEPNDYWQLANRFDPAQPVTGRSGQVNDQDYFEFTVSDAAADSLLRATVDTADPGQAVRLCLLDATGQLVQCRAGITPLQLPDLLLKPGRWGLRVFGAADAMAYRLTVTEQGPIKPDTEVEPNDTFEWASSVPEKNRISGTFSGDDEDFFRFTVTAEPQLWRFQVVGDGLTQVAYYDASGAGVQTIDPRGTRRARLENLYLLPGQHYLKVAGKAGGSYTVLARALGPPDPNAEREPNDEEAGMQRLAMEQTRTGLLAEASDTDYYRFFLANWDHIQLTVQPAADGAIDALLYWQGQQLARSRSTGPGQKLELAGVYPPGDYHLVLTPTTVSDAEYHLSLARLPRYGCPVDCEPNGNDRLFSTAALPKDGIVMGRAGDWGTADTYALPVLAEAAELIIRSEKAVPLAIGRNKFDSTRLVFDATSRTYQASLLPGIAYQLIIDPSGAEYRLAVEINGEAGEPAGELAAELALNLDADEVAAYLTYGQRVGGELQITNTAAEPISVTLEATTSDFRWQVSLSRAAVTLAPGARESVPLEIRVPRDAWADRPVRISARVRNGVDAQAETWQEVSIRRNLPAVGASLDWPLPDSLVGGFNVAWSALGSRWVGSSRTGTGNYEYLFNDQVYGRIMTCCPTAYGWNDEPRPELTIELSALAPVPVAGIALNHFAPGGNPWAKIREGALLLSDDGEEFREVLRFATQPVETEQYFALPQPQMARFARLRADSTFEVRSGSYGLILGEWKVLAVPGFDLSAGSGFNLATRALGGHVVSDSPPNANHLTSILEPNVRNTGLNYLAAGKSLEYVIGFHHNRAAQIRRINWIYGDVPDNGRFERVKVSVSTESPLGPWAPIGEIVTGDPAAASFLELAAPVWARFVRFTSARPEDAYVQYGPLAIEIWERPTDANYQSILAEWGNANRAAGYEREQGLPPRVAVTAADNTSRDRAARMIPDESVSGQAALAEQERWYRLQMPAESNVVTFNMTGDPTVRTVIRLEDSDGAEIPLRRLERASTPVRHVLEAVVQPGAEVYIRVSEPPRNVMFTWDTSASVNQFLPTIYNSLNAFASSVTSGQEAVNMLPFSDLTPLLRDWYGEPYILQTILNDYPRALSSSSGETALKRSAEALAPRAGSKSILVITDGRVVHDGEMWEAMREAQPRIFGVHIGGLEPENQDLFQDWASINGGDYQYLYYDGEMEIAFDRAATLMRRAADFTLTASTSYRKAPGPGRLSVVSGESGAGANAAVELILDASGSMLQRINGKRRINIAKEVLVEAVTKHIPAATPVALRVFGHKEPDACRTDLEIPLGPLDPAAAASTINAIQAMNLARTPIADSLAAVSGDVSDADGRVVIVLVTDGEETCEGNPAQVIASLKARGIDVNLNIVGFAIDDIDLATQFADWAELGGGRYFVADDQTGLTAAIVAALDATYVVFDSAGRQVADGFLDGEPVSLAPGSYRVVVKGAKTASFSDVNVVGGQETSLTVK